MSYSIEEVLGYVPLTRAIQTVKAGVPTPLPEAFYRRDPSLRVLGDKTRRIEFTGTRKNAQVVPYGAPPKQITHLPLSSRDIRLLHTEEEIQFSHELFLQIREFDRYVVQDRFREEASRQVMQAKVRQENLLTSTTHLMLAKGALYFDSSGNLLSSSSGADLTVDYGIPANNQNQINGVIDASWATTTTNIVQHINDIKQKAVNTTGYDLKYALYGKNIMRYMVKNETVKEYLRYQTGPDMAGYLTKSNQIPKGLFDLEWIPMQNTFWDSAAGAVVEIFGGDTIMFCPDVADPSVYGIYEGSYTVPKNFGVTQDAMGQWANFEMVYGRYGYGIPNLRPAGIFGVYGDTFLPMLNVPSAFFLADVTP